MNRLVSPKTLSKAHRKLPQALSVRLLTFGVATPIAPAWGSPKNWRRVIRPTPSGNATFRSATNRIGDVLVAQGDGGGALTAYRASLGICEKMAARDPANTEWQRDLSISHNKIGDVLLAQGDGGGALTAYRAGLGIREKLASRDPANTEWQRDLSVSHIKIGDVLVAQGDGGGALTAYRASLGIAEKLAARDPANTQWQCDLAICCGRLATPQLGQGFSQRQSLLMRGRQLLLNLDSDGRLQPNQNSIPWFQEQLRALESEPTAKRASTTE